jgi:predicted nuclease with TOPRIM domain
VVDRRVVRAGVGVDAGVFVSDTVNVDTLHDRIVSALARLPADKAQVDALSDARDLAARARELERRLKLEYQVRIDTRTMLEAAEADRDRLARRVAELEQEALRWHDEYVRTAMECGKAQARVAELEAALGRALRLADWYAHRLGEHPKDCQWCQMAVEQQDALAGDGGGANG